MTVEEIKKFVDRGLLSRKILMKATGVKKAAMSNRLNQGRNFSEEEIKRLRKLYRNFFKKLYQTEILKGESNEISKQTD